MSLPTLLSKPILKLFNQVNNSVLLSNLILAGTGWSVLFHKQVSTPPPSELGFVLLANMLIKGWIGSVVYALPLVIFIWLISRFYEHPVSLIKTFNITAFATLPMLLLFPLGVTILFSDFPATEIGANELSVFRLLEIFCFTAVFITGILSLKHLQQSSIFKAAATVIVAIATWYSFILAWLYFLMDRYTFYIW